MKVTIPNAHIFDKFAQGLETKVGIEFSSTFIPEITALLDRLNKKHNGYGTVTIATPRRPRSTGWKSQCNHFNGHVQQIADHTGNEFNDVKLYLKRNAFKRGYPFMLDADGTIIVSLNDKEPMPQSEADASVEESNMLIEEAHELAIELDIVLRENDEQN